MAADPRPARARGRPRSTTVDRALTRAALAEFTARGLHGLSMEAIAARAGVSKVSLYRRWRSRLDVVAEVLGLLGEARPPEDRGSLEADIKALLEASIESRSARSMARLVLRTIGEVSGSPELLALYRTHLLRPRMAQLEVVVERARARGELRASISSEVASAVIAGPLFLHALTVLTQLDGALPSDLAAQLTHAILHGIGGHAPVKRGRR